MPVKVSITQRQHEFAEGKDVSIGCDVEGYPIPQVEWYKDGQPLQQSQRVQISGDILCVFLKNEVNILLFFFRESQIVY